LIDPETKRDSLPNEAEKFLETSAAVPSSHDLRASAPWLDRRLRRLDRERRAIVGALLAIPAGSRMLSSALLRRIRALAKADNLVAYDCYWHDLGGES